MQQRDAAVNTGLGVDHFVEAGDAEAESVAALAAVHVVAVRQHQLEDLTHAAAGVELLARQQRHCKKATSRAVTSLYGQHRASMRVFGEQRPVIRVYLLHQ